MMKVLIVIFLLSMGKVGIAQLDSSALLNKAYLNAELMTSSFQSGDFDSFIELTHPKIILFSGGKEKVKEVLELGLGPGVNFISTELSKPKRLIAKDSLYQCVLTQKQVLSFEGRKFYTIGTLIGVSYDSGDSWTFIGMAKNTLFDLRQRFPELSEELKVRTQTDPIEVID